MNTLTWHRGSLRSYASLWLTLRQLSSLNSLKISDLPLDSNKKYKPTYKGSISKNVDLNALARLIEEPLEKFKFSDDRLINRCWDFLFTKDNAFCETCLSMGYHTQFFSLKLLNRCPIHDEPLSVDCPCMKNQCVRDEGIALSQPETCKCGNLRYFDPSQLHKNHHHFIDTDKLTPIAIWLESLNKIYVGSYMNPEFDSIYESDWLSRLNDLSQMHEILYPSAFIKNRVSHYRWAYKTQSIELSVNEKKQEKNSNAYCNFYLSINHPYLIDVYKSLARHIRKHVARRSEYLVKKFASLGTPEEISNLIRSNQASKLALTELIWATCLAPSSKYMRWDNRKNFYEPGNVRYGFYFSDILRTTEINLSLDLEAIKQANEWVGMHTFGTFCLALWKQAEKMVEDGIRRNQSFWVTTSIDQTNLFVYTASKVSNENRTEFTFYVDEPLSLPSLKKMTKQERVSRFRNQCEEKSDQILKSCSGLCLTWSKRDGWHTTQSAITIDNWKLRKVLITGRHGLKAVLYRSQDHYVLQLLEHKLQVLSVEFSGLFDLMRLRFFEYSKLNHVTLREKIKLEPPNLKKINLKKLDLQHKDECTYEINGRGFCNSAFSVYLSSLKLRVNRQRLMSGVPPIP